MLADERVCFAYVVLLPNANWRLLLLLLLRLVTVVSDVGRLITRIDFLIDRHDHVNRTSHTVITRSCRRMNK